MSTDLDRTRSSVVSHRQVQPIRLQGILRTPKHDPDVGGMLPTRVKVGEFAAGQDEGDLLERMTHGLVERLVDRPTQDSLELLASVLPNSRRLFEKVPDRVLKAEPGKRHEASAFEECQIHDGIADSCRTGGDTVLQKTSQR